VVVAAVVERKDSCLAVSAKVPVDKIVKWDMSSSNQSLCLRCKIASRRLRNGTTRTIEVIEQNVTNEFVV
jgi:hypothetical protein